MASIKIKTGGNSTLVGVMVPVGSRNEPDNIKGISHFLEHMMFKGTKKRNKNELKRALDKYGAEFNAWTSEEHTFYYATIGNQYVDVAREVIEDMVSNSIFPAEELEKEKQVVLQELEMYEDNPQSHVFEVSQQDVFKEGSGLHIPIIGTRETVKAIDRETLLNYYNDNYKVKVSLDIGGILSEERNRVYLDRSFEKEEKDYTTDDHIVPRQGVNQANMVMTGLIHLESIKDHYKLKLLSAILNGFTGRFFDVIREQHNLVYHSSFYHQVHSCGTVQYWGYAGLMPDKVQLAKKLMKELLTQPVTQEELEFARQKWLGQYQLALDKKTSIAKVLIDSTVNNLDYEAYLRDYEQQMRAVSLDNLNKFIEKADFNSSKLVAVVPEK
jgi:predicted Zn-dependent peptidase